MLSHWLGIDPDNELQNHEASCGSRTSGCSGHSMARHRGTLPGMSTTSTQSSSSKRRFVVSWKKSSFALHSAQGGECFMPRR